MISLKKHNKPKIKETMAVIKVINTKFDKWILIATPTNMAAIAKDTHKPAKINKPTYQRIQDVRTAMMSNSSKNNLR